jgi:hypothetical protein
MHLCFVIFIWIFLDRVWISNFTETLRRGFPLRLARLSQKLHLARLSHKKILTPPRVVTASPRHAAAHPPLSTLPPWHAPSPTTPRHIPCQTQSASPVTATTFTVPPPPQRHQEEVVSSPVRTSSHAASRRHRDRKGRPTPAPGCMLGYSSRLPAWPEFAGYYISPLVRPWSLATPCFKCFRLMFQVFYLDVTKVDMGCRVCCKPMFQVFQTYVSNVSSVCFIYCYGYTHMFQAYVSSVSGVSDVCCKCFI